MKTHRIMFLLAAALYCVLSALAAVPSAPPLDVVERAQHRGKEIVDLAITALGGEEALRGINNVTLAESGQTTPRLQMPTPSGPNEAGTFEEQLTLDLKNSRLLVKNQGAGAGFQFNAVNVIKGGEGSAFDLRARTVTPIPSATATSPAFVQYYRRLPHLLLRQALDRSGTVRYLGDDTFNGRKHNVITFVMADGSQIAMFVDAGTNLISKYEQVFTDPLLGDRAAAVVYGPYSASGNTKVPSGFDLIQAGDVVTRLKYTAVKFNSTLDDKMFEPKTEGFVAAKAAPPGGPEAVNKLADGVFLLENVAGPNQNMLAVEFKDYILVVEAPGTSAGTATAVAKIKEAIPGKPIRYVVPTHHHGDHIGGLRTLMAEDATVVTTPGNRWVIEAEAAAPIRDALARNPRKPKIEVIQNKKRVFEDESQRVEILDVGPNSHAKEMLIAYLPKQKLIFQGDLFIAPLNDAPVGPAQPTTVDFAKRVKELGLQVERIAGVHGKLATWPDVEQAVASSQRPVTGQ